MLEGCVKDNLILHKTQTDRQIKSQDTSMDARFKVNLTMIILKLFFIIWKNIPFKL